MSEDINPKKVMKRLVITENSEWEMFVYDEERHLWWLIPTEDPPIDIGRLNRDCIAICKGKIRTSYLEFAGKYNPSNAYMGDGQHKRFSGMHQFGLFYSDQSMIRIEPWYQKFWFRWRAV